MALSAALATAPFAAIFGCGSDVLVEGGDEFAPTGRNDGPGPDDSARTQNAPDVTLCVADARGFSELTRDARTMAVNRALEGAGYSPGENVMVRMNFPNIAILGGYDCERMGPEVSRAIADSRLALDREKQSTARRMNVRYQCNERRELCRCESNQTLCAL